MTRIGNRVLAEHFLAWLDGKESDGIVTESAQGVQGIGGVGRVFRLCSGFGGFVLDASV